MNTPSFRLDNIYIERFERSIKYKHNYLNSAKNGQELFEGTDCYYNYYNQNTKVLDNSRF